VRNAIPIFTLLPIWAIGVAVVRKRRKRDLQWEIDELNEIEKESRS
jgi:hypothetical protein